MILYRVKPAEPESITGNLGPVEEPVSNPAVKAIPAALARPLPRPRLDAPKLRVKAQVAKALTAQLEKNPLSEVPTTSLADTDGRISVGEPCKNGGCAQVRMKSFSLLPALLPASPPPSRVIPTIAPKTTPTASTTPVFPSFTRA